MIENNFEKAKDVFIDLRSFTEEEEKIYNDSLNKLYIPTGLNIWDL